MLAEASSPDELFDSLEARYGDALAAMEAPVEEDVPSEEAPVQQEAVQQEAVQAKQPSSAIPEPGGGARASTFVGGSADPNFVRPGEQPSGASVQPQAPIRSAVSDEKQKALDEERQKLQREHRQGKRDADEVTGTMLEESKALLRLFGIPYIVAPMEAEAQCAELERLGLVQGVITNDSDTFLFGANTVYRNIFDEQKYVEKYQMSDIERELGLTRDKLIHLALMLGSDYTEGVSGIGIVNAIETVNAFPDMESLERFRMWVFQQTEDLELNPLQQDYSRKHMGLRKNWRVGASFPNPLVCEAYLKPTVDNSEERLSWARPDLNGLRRFLTGKLEYTIEKADEVLMPVIKAYDTRTAQPRIDNFMQVERAAVIQSARIAKAVRSLRQGRALTSDMVSHAAEGELGAEQPSQADVPPPAKPPKRVKTAYMLFLDDFRAEFREENPGARMGDVSKQASCRWRTMAADERDVYDKKHQQLKAQAAGMLAPERPLVDSSQGAESAATTGTCDDVNAKGPAKKRSRKLRRIVANSSDEEYEEESRALCRPDARGVRLRKARHAAGTGLRSNEDAGSALGGMGCNDWRTAEKQKSRNAGQKKPAKHKAVVLSDCDTLEVDSGDAMPGSALGGAGCADWRGTSRGPKQKKSKRVHESDSDG